MNGVTVWTCQILGTWITGSALSVRAWIQDIWRYRELLVETQKQSVTATCRKCGGALREVIKGEANTTDVLGAVIVGVLVLGFIALIFSGAGHRGAYFLVLIAGVVAYGLHSMIGYTKRPILRCADCGQVQENRTL